MKQSNSTLEEIKLVGLSVRTSFSLESNPETAKIGATIGKYFQENLGSKISNKINSGKTYSVYTDYESDEMGEYKYFFGEEVKSFDKLEPGLTTLRIIKQDYAKFDVGPGKMPDICIKAWQDIWKMTSDDLGGKRNFIADFEIYDSRSADPANASFDIYVGIEKSK